MWKLYDELINGIPQDLIVDELVVGHQWTFIRSGLGCGLGVKYPIETRLPVYSGNIIGMPLREIASFVKSWNFIEASIGAAAINSYYNSIESAVQNGIEISMSKHFDDRLNDPFISYQQLIKGKNVAVIGHFPYLETLFEPISNLSIIEMNPIDGDYPYYAIEYLLHEQDYVFITCGAIVNKSLPRLLELSKNAHNILVGPATPMAPALFTYGINDLSGFVIKDNAAANKIISGGIYGSLYSLGQKVHLSIAE